jgi:uncharacterized protein (TIGR03067 family)
MKPRLLILAVTSVLIAADAPQEHAAKTDKEEIQDTWRLVAVEKDGVKVEGGLLSGRFIITGDKIKSSVRGFGEERQEMAYKLDTTTKPKAIDITITKEDDKGGKWQGIYSLRGDKLKMCFNTNGSGRPKVFATEKDDGNTQFFLVRE